MNRRGSSHNCQERISKIGTKNFDVPVANILYKPQREWDSIRSTNKRFAFQHKISVDWKAFDISKYLITHATIVVSVNVEDNGYYIKPPCDELVNNNGNAWPDEILLSTFRTFIGKPNYLEHLQVPALSKGQILDAILRPIIHKGQDGTEVTVYSCDILVATDRIHEDLVSKIVSGKLNTMSMGASVQYTTCSKCGRIIPSDQEPCEHIAKELLDYFIDEKGIKRRVAELCGRFIEVGGKRVPDPESMTFVEASWVERPAYEGACINHYISNIDQEITTKMLSDRTNKDLFLDLSKLRVSDRDGALVLKVAKEKEKNFRFGTIAQKLLNNNENTIIF